MLRYWAVHPDADSTKCPTPHTSSTCTHWEGLTFLIYLLPLAWQSSGNSKQDSGSHSAAVHQEPLRVLQLMESSQFFLRWSYFLGRYSLVTG